MIHDKRRFSVVLGALALAFAPHFLRVPLFVGGFVCAAWGYALGMQYRGWAVPPRWLRVILALACLVAVFAYYGRSFGRDGGVALLSLMLGLKAVESKSVRDMLAMLFLAYFVVVTNVLYTQGLVMSSYMVFSVLVVTAALVHLHSERSGLIPGRAARGRAPGPVPAPGGLALRLLPPAARSPVGRAGRPRRRRERLQRNPGARLGLDADPVERGGFPGGFRGPGA